jgi:hypothetical protein
VAEIVAFVAALALVAVLPNKSSARTVLRRTGRTKTAV